MPRPHHLLAAALAALFLLSCTALADFPEPALRDADADADADGSTWTCAGGYLDPVTSSCWQDPPRDGTFNWDDAVAYCDGLSLAGHGPGSWHLPTIGELRSLVRGCPATEFGGACGVTDACLAEGCRGSSCDGCSLGGGPGAGGAYWPAELGGTRESYWSSSSVAGEGSLVWGVYFYLVHVVSYSKTATVYVRCVRRGP